METRYKIKTTKKMKNKWRNHPQFRFIRNALHQHVNDIIWRAVTGFSETRRAKTVGRRGLHFLAYIWILMPVKYKPKKGTFPLHRRSNGPKKHEYPLATISNHQIPSFNHGPRKELLENEEHSRRENFLLTKGFKNYILYHVRQTCQKTRTKNG